MGGNPFPFNDLPKQPYRDPESFCGLAATLRPLTPNFTVGNKLHGVRVLLRGVAEQRQCVADA